MRRVSHVRRRSRAAVMYALFSDWATMSEAPSSRRKMKGVAEPKAQTLSDAQVRTKGRVSLFASQLLVLLCLLIVVSIGLRVHAVTKVSKPDPATANTS